MAFAKPLGKHGDMGTVPVTAGAVESMGTWGQRQSRQALRLHENESAKGSLGTRTQSVLRPATSDEDLRAQ